MCNLLHYFISFSLLYIIIISKVKTFQIVKKYTFQVFMIVAKQTKHLWLVLNLTKYMGVMFMSITVYCISNFVICCHKPRNSHNVYIRCIQLVINIA